MTKIACFITPHGFGHATRMIAILEALQKQIPNLHPHLFTRVPESLFAETLTHFSYHPLSCDIGLIQKDGLHADIAATISQLQAFLPFNAALVDELARTIRGCRLVLCDIAPLGIAVAKKAGIKSVLIENFTWDWIYKAYLQEHQELEPAIRYLTSQYKQADIHIRCKPYCGPAQGDLACEPVCRSIRSRREDVRNKLQCKNRKVVLITMGGVNLELPFIEQLPQQSDIFFILAGQQETKRMSANVLLLARDSDFYHPDLINSADLVICKSGYSTIAECAQAAVPVLTVGRARFPESAILEEFSIAQLNGQSLKQEEFFCGSWLKSLNTFLGADHKPAPSINGADSVAKYLSQILL